MKRRLALLGWILPALLYGAPAAAGPALFRASFIMHAFGNDVTSGTAYPFTASTFRGMPFGHSCSTAHPYTANGAPAPGYCGPSTRRQGAPATGSGTLSLGAGAPAAVALPQSAFGITVTGLFANHYPYLQSFTYATFVNAPGSFFAGGGPAAGLGQKTHTGMGQQAGRWVVREGAHGFGGVMGLLGRLGANAAFGITGKAGTYEGTNSWNMIRALGRARYATPTAFTSMGKASNWLNPHEHFQYYTNNLNGNVSTLVARGSGTPWTTGSVTLYATAGVYQTILHRAGYDITTPGGARNIQLVTPALTHWIGPGWQDHTGHIGILSLQVPEPGVLALLLAGVGALGGLQQWAARRRGRAQQAGRRGRASRGRGPDPS